MRWHLGHSHRALIRSRITASTQTAVLRAVLFDLGLERSNSWPNKDGYLGLVTIKVFLSDIVVDLKWTGDRLIRVAFLMMNCPCQTACLTKIERIHPWHRILCYVEEICIVHFLFIHDLRTNVTITQHPSPIQMLLSVGDSVAFLPRHLPIQSNFVSTEPLATIWKSEAASSF